MSAEPAGGKPRTDPALRAWARWKLACIILGFFIGGIALKFVSESLLPQSSLIRTPVDLLGDSFISAALIAAIFEVFIRQQTEKITEQRLGVLLSGNNNELVRRIVDAAALQNGIISNLDDATRDRVLRSSLAGHVGSESLADQLIEWVIPTITMRDEICYDWDQRLIFLPNADRDEFASRYFDVKIQIKYKSRSIARQLIFGTCKTEDEVWQRRFGPDRWTVAHRLGVLEKYDQNDPRLFRLDGVRVGGETLEVRRSISDEGGQRFDVHVPDRFIDSATPVEVEYSYTVKLPKVGHRVGHYLTQPCKNVSFEVDYSQVDIALGQLLQFTLAPHEDVMLRNFDERDGVRRMQTNGWVLAGGGFAFTWKLRVETLAEFWSLDKRRMKRLVANDSGARRSIEPHTDTDVIHT